MGNDMHEYYEVIANFYGIRFFAASIVYRLAVCRGVDCMDELPITVALNMVMQDQRECMCIAAGPCYWATPHEWN